MTKIKGNTSLLLKDNTSIVNSMDHINNMIQISKRLASRPLGLKVIRFIDFPYDFC